MKQSPPPTMLLACSDGSLLYFSFAVGHEKQTIHTEIVDRRHRDSPAARQGEKHQLFQLLAWGLILPGCLGDIRAPRGGSSLPPAPLSV